MKILSQLTFVFALCLLSVSSFAQNNETEEFKAVININGETREFTDPAAFERAMEEMDVGTDIELDIEQGAEENVRIWINTLESGSEDDVLKQLNINLDDIDVNMDEIEEMMEGLKQHIDIDIDTDDSNIKIFRFDTEGMEEQMNQLFQSEGNGEKLMFKQYCHKSANKAFLGVFPDYCCNCTEEGVKIKRVVESSAAEKAGLLADDVLISIDGKQLGKEMSLHHSLAEYEVGDEVTIVYKRGDVVNTINVALGKHEDTSQMFKSHCEDFQSKRYHHNRLDYNKFSAEMQDKPLLGVYLGETLEPGVLVTGIVEGSAAETAELMENDRILSIDAVPTETPQELSAEIKSKEIGDIVEVKYVRDGKTSTKSVVLGKKEHSSAWYGGCGKPLGMIEKETQQKKEQKILFRDKQGNLQELEMDEDVEVIIIDGEAGNVSIDKIIDENGTTKVVKLKVLVDEANEAEKQILRSIDSKAGTMELPRREELKVEQFDFYPNPNNGKFTIDFDLIDRGSMIVRIVDLAGQEVYRDVQPDFTGKYRNTIDITDSASGTYLIQVQQNGKEMTKKVVIQ